MFEFLKKDTPSNGSIFFRGNIAPRAEEFSFLSRFKIEVTTQDARGAQWALKLRHPRWGEADMICLRNMPPPPRELLEYQHGLTEEDRAEAAGAEQAVSFSVPATRGNVLRDRKNLLKFMAAAMGDDAVLAADHTSQRFWSRAMLKDELSHDADLHVSGVYCVHAVTTDNRGEDDPPVWVHTHGLAALGAFDFDIVRPSAGFCDSCGAFMDAVAFAIIEGALKPDTASFGIAYPGGTIRMVPAAAFDRQASAEDLAARGAGDADHVEKRSVICEPAGGWLSRLLRRGAAPSRFCRSADLEGCVMHLSQAATELMAKRAAATLGVLRTLREEFGDLELPTLVKMGYETDSGGGNAEHLWFEVHEIFDDGVDATLVNEPHNIASMKVGQREKRPISRLTDWAMMTPVGQITPTSLSAARTIRTHKDKFREVLAAMRAAGQG